MQELLVNRHGIPAPARRSAATLGLGMLKVRAALIASAALSNGPEIGSPFQTVAEPLRLLITSPGPESDPGRRAGQ